MVTVVIPDAFSVWVMFDTGYERSIEVAAVG